VTAAGVAFYMLLTVLPGALALIGLFGLFVPGDEIKERLADLGELGGLLLGLWSASAGVRALMQACNVAYDVEERRPLLRSYRTSVVLTIFGLALAALAVGLALALPFAVRWPLVGLAMMLGLAVLYRYAPCRAQPRWQWVSWGAAIATTLWLAGTGLLSLYVASLGHFNRLYGTLGAVVIVLLWLLITGHAILLGAELNAEMERQTQR